MIMKTSLILLLFCTLVLKGICQNINKPASPVLLPNGWSLSPAGKSIPLGDLPLNIVVSASRKWLAVTNNGQSIQSIQLIDAARGKILDNIIIPYSWLGLAFGDKDQSLYVSGGNLNRIFLYSIKQTKLHLQDSIILGEPWPNKISPAGLVVDDIHHQLFVVTKDNNSLYVIDLRSKKISLKLQLPAEGYTCVLSPDKQQLYISCWGARQLLIYNIRKQKITDSIEVGTHPSDICLTRNGKFLFVANAEDNSVSIVNLSKKQVVETLNAALYPASVPGSATNAVALSDDDKQLFVANADNNCVAVFNVSAPGSSTSQGFIPVGLVPDSPQNYRPAVIRSQWKRIYFQTES